MKKVFPTPQGSTVFSLSLILQLLACSALVAQTNCIPVPAGAVSWWKAENNTLDSIGLNDGQAVNGGVAYGPGEVGTAFSLANTEILIGDPRNLQFSNSFSIEAWVNVTAPPNAFQQLGQILYRGNPGAYLDSYYLAVLPNGGLRFHILDNSGVGLYDANLETAPIGTGVWTHVAAVLDAGAMRVYTNGQLVAQANANVTPLQTLGGGGVAIGNTSLAPAGPTGPFNPLPPYPISAFSQPFGGSLDELTVYARALSAAEIQAIFNAGSFGKCRNPVAPLITTQPVSESVFVGDSVSFSVAVRGDAPLSYQWLFNSSPIVGQTNASVVVAGAQPSDAGNYSVTVSNIAGSVTSSNAVLTVMAVPTNCVPVPAGLISWWRGDGSALDSVGLNNGTLIDGATFAPGKVGQSFSFNGINQVVQIPDAPSLNPTAALTLEGWVNVTAFSPGGATAVAGKDNPYGGRQYMIGMANVSGQWVFRAHVGVPSGLALFNGATALQTNTWYHVAMTYDGAFLRLYVNGAQDGSLAVGGPVVTSTEALRIGGSVPGPWDFNGRIDEVSFYGVALSSAQVQSIYNAGAAGKCPGSVPPAIISQPRDQTTTVGGSAMFSVAAIGSAPLSYQWLFNGSNLVGQTASSLVLSNVQPSDAGTYAVMVTNAAGSVLSSNPTLNVVPVPTNCILAPSGLVGWWRGEGNGDDSAGFSSATLLAGTTFTAGEVGQAFSFNGSTSGLQVPASPLLDVGARGGLTIETWINPVNSAQEQDLVEWNNGLGFIGTHFAISVPYGVGGSSSLWGNLVDTAGNPHPITSASGLLAGNVFQHVALTYDKASGLATLYLNGNPVIQTNLGSFTPYTASDLYIGWRPSGPFTGLRFTGAMDEISIYDRALSPAEILRVYVAGSFGKCALGIAPNIITQPISQTVQVGDNVSFTVLANGDTPLSYQWQFNNASLPGQTNSSLILSNVQPGEAGAYSVVVTNSVGSVTSSNAALTVLAAFTNCITPPSGLVSWWRAEGNALDSVGQNNGTLLNGAAFAAGKVGQAFSFNGVDQVVQVPDAPSLNPGSALTLEGWVNVAAFSAGGATAVAGKDNPYGGRQYMIGMANISGNWIFRAHVGVPSGLELFNGSTALKTNTWYHVAMTYDGAFLRLYVNGIPDGSLPVTGPVVTSSEALIIGGSVPGPWDFDGRIDELSFYNRALSESEIQTIYSAASFGKCAGQGQAPNLLTQPAGQTAETGATVDFSVLAVGQAPLSYQWLFDSLVLPGQTNSSLVLSNVQASDSGQYSVIVTNSIGANTSSNAVLTVVGPPPTNCTPAPAGLISWWRAEGNALDSVGQNDGTLINGASFTVGEVGEAFSFNGVDQVVQVPDAPSLNPTSALTLEGWVNITSFSPGGATAVAGKDNPYGGRQYMIGMANVGGQWVFRAHVGVPSGLELFNGSTALHTNNWYHVAMTYDGADLRLFVNGVPDGSLVVTGAVVTSSESLIIGGSVPGPWDFNGEIDELSLYGQALSASEIQTIYNAGNAGKCPNPPTPPTPAARLLSPARSVGTFEVRFTGTPNQTYSLQRALNMTGPWLPIGSLTLSPTGAGAYTDTNSPSGTAFYRLVSQ